MRGGGILIYFSAGQYAYIGFDSRCDRGSGFINHGNTEFAGQPGNILGISGITAAGICVEIRGGIAAIYFAVDRGVPEKVRIHINGIIDFTSGVLTNSFNDCTRNNQCFAFNNLFFKRSEH